MASISTAPLPAFAEQRSWKDELLLILKDKVGSQEVTDIANLEKELKDRRYEKSNDQLKNFLKPSSKMAGGEEHKILWKLCKKNVGGAKKGNALKTSGNSQSPTSEYTMQDYLDVLSGDGHGSFDGNLLASHHPPSHPSPSPPSLFPPDHGGDDGLPSFAVGNGPADETASLCYSLPASGCAASVEATAADADSTGAGGAGVPLGRHGNGLAEGNPVDSDRRDIPGSGSGVGAWGTFGGSDGADLPFHPQSNHAGVTTRFGIAGGFDDGGGGGGGGKKRKDLSSQPTSVANGGGGLQQQYASQTQLALDLPRTGLIIRANYVVVDQLFTATEVAADRIVGHTVGPSDQRLKIVQGFLGDGYLEKLGQLRVKLFEWNEESGRGGTLDAGIIAQEVQALFADTELKDRVVEDVRGVLHVRWNTLQTITLKALQELAEKHQTSEESREEQSKWQIDFLTALKDKFGDLEEHVDEIETRARTTEGVVGHLKERMAKLEVGDSSSKVAELDKDAIDIISGKKGKLGRGSHGIVKRGQMRSLDGSIIKIAVKMVPVDDPDARLALHRELGILSSLQHPRIVRHYGTVDNEDDDELWAVLELCELGSLARVLRVSSHDGDTGSAADLLKALDDSNAGSGSTAAPSSSSGATARQRLAQLLGGPLPGVGNAFFRVARDIASGVAYLHSKKVAHGDLKPGNILLDGRGDARVADFGVARIVRTTVGGGGRTTDGGGAMGTAGYMAPEVAKGVKASTGSDVFSFGMLLYELLTGEPPFSHLKNDVAIGMAVTAGERPPLPTHSDGDVSTLRLTELISEMWKDEPSSRPLSMAILSALDEATELHSNSMDKAGTLALLTQHPPLPVEMQQQDVAREAARKLSDQKPAFDAKLDGITADDESSTSPILEQLEAAATEAETETLSTRVVELSGIVAGSPYDKFMHLMGEYEEVEGQQVHGAPLFRRTSSGRRFSIFKSSRTGMWVANDDVTHIAANQGYLRFPKGDVPSGSGDVAGESGWVGCPLLVTKLWTLRGAKLGGMAAGGASFGGGAKSEKLLTPPLESDLNWDQAVNIESGAAEAENIPAIQSQDPHSDVAGTTSSASEEPGQGNVGNFCFGGGGGGKEDRVGVVLTAEVGRGLAAGTRLVFTRRSGYSYSGSCINNETVTYLRTNGGSSPAQVRWRSGFTCEVNWKDLVFPATAEYVSSTSSILEQLLKMGFPKNQAVTAALAQGTSDIETAVNALLTSGSPLSDFSETMPAEAQGRRKKVFSLPGGSIVRKLGVFLSYNREVGTYCSGWSTNSKKTAAGAMEGTEGSADGFIALGTTWGHPVPKTALCHFL